MDTQFFVRKKLGGSTKKSFKIAQRYLQGKDGLLTLHGKTSPKVAALVVDNCQQDDRYKKSRRRKEKKKKRKNKRERLQLLPSKLLPLSERVRMD